MIWLLKLSHYTDCKSIPLFLDNSGFILPRVPYEFNLAKSISGIVSPLQLYFRKVRLISWLVNGIPKLNANII